MSIGRSEKRIWRAVTVEVCLPTESERAQKTLTENVSAHGARILMQQKLQPGQQVLVNSPREGVKSKARIVYCQAVSGGRFAVGLEMPVRVDLWAKPY
jgi:PilZ domain